MFYLNYTKKDESGKIVAVKFYPNESEVIAIRAELLKPRMTQKQIIDFRGQILKTANIEILDESEQVNEKKFRFDLYNDADKQIIQNFEEMILGFFEDQIDKTHRTPEHYMLKHGIVHFEGESHLGADSGTERWHPYQLRILQPLEYTDFTEKWSALQRLRFIRTKAKINEEKAIESLSEIKDEFNVAEIPF